MWIVTLDLHTLARVGLTRIFETERPWLAYFVYQWWLVNYIFSSAPIKRVSLHRTKNGILYLKGKKVKSQNAELLRIAK